MQEIHWGSWRAVNGSTRGLPPNSTSCHLPSLSTRQARRTLKLMEARRGFELKILKALGQELTVQTQNIIYLLGQDWDQMAVWKLAQSKGRGLTVPCGGVCVSSS